MGTPLRTSGDTWRFSISGLANGALNVSLAPDANDIEVIVQGKYGRDGVFHATEVLAKCGSRYESELQNAKKT